MEAPAAEVWAAGRDVGGADRLAPHVAALMERGTRDMTKRFADRTRI
ncbi:hypothetical protein [Nonomuraea cavernae]